ncbi:hypothetical protein [Enterococcus mundtii]|uniref:hypothetical protein n=1 Tax=Enterococcus mundtii TaxID=53346 RepID=UPI001A97BB88|nr:hypothetical protein [Enterococcus mundtii]MBO1087151.1 hypothetical protein [Enterococcus mundtii]
MKDIISNINIDGNQYYALSTGSGHYPCISSAKMVHGEEGNCLFINYEKYLGNEIKTGDSFSHSDLKDSEFEATNLGMMVTSDEEGIKSLRAMSYTLLQFSNELEEHLKGENNE